MSKQFFCCSCNKRGDSILKINVVSINDASLLESLNSSLRKKTIREIETGNFGDPRAIYF